jgi:WD40 repeat protein
MLWDTTKSQILKTYLPPAKSSGVRGTLSPDSQTVVISGKGTVFYNCETGEEIRSLPENAGRFVRYSPDGTTFLLHRKQIVIGKPNEHTFVLWDVASWKEIKTFKMLSKFDIGSVVFHPQEKVLAVVDSNQRVVFWDLEKGISMKTIEAPSKKDRVLSCVFAPDGKTLAMGFIGEREKGIGFWDWAAGTAIRTIRIEQGYDFRGVGMLIFSRDGKTLLVAAGAKILVLGER